MFLIITHIAIIGSLIIVIIMYSIVFAIIFMLNKRKKEKI
jgi:hypothetical protein